MDLRCFVVVASPVVVIALINSGECGVEALPGLAPWSLPCGGARGATSLRRLEKSYRTLCVSLTNAVERAMRPPAAGRAGGRFHTSLPAW